MIHASNDVIEQEMMGMKISVNNFLKRDLLERLSVEYFFQI